MMNQRLARMWDTGLLNPVRAIDWLLDRLEELSVAMMPVQTVLIPCRQSRRGTRFD